MSLVIAFEGIDGSGKSTLAHMLVKKIRSDEVQFIDKNTNRPLRKMYGELMKEEKFISDELSLFLGLADYKYTEERIEDRNKKYIIYDRCFISTIVDAMSLGVLHLEELPLYMNRFRIPDIIYFIDADASQVIHEKKNISVAEAGGRRASPTDLLTGFLDYQNENYRGYLTILGKYIKTEIVKVNRTSIDSSFQQVFGHFSSYISK